MCWADTSDPTGRPSRHRSVAVQALPPNRTGVGGAVTQAVRQFGGSFGVALTIAFIGSATLTTDLAAGFGQLWWLLVFAGLATAMFALSLRAPTS